MTNPKPEGVSLCWLYALFLVLAGAVVASFAYDRGHHDACDDHCTTKNHHHGRYGSAGACVCFDHAEAE